MSPLAHLAGSQNEQQEPFNYCKVNPLTRSCSPLQTISSALNPGYNEPPTQRTPGYNEPSRWAPPWRIQVKSCPLQRISGHKEPLARVQKGSLYPGFTVYWKTVFLGSKYGLSLQVSYFVGTDEAAFPFAGGVAGQLRSPQAPQAHPLHKRLTVLAVEMEQGVLLVVPLSGRDPAYDAFLQNLVKGFTTQQSKGPRCSFWDSKVRRGTHFINQIKKIIGCFDPRHIFSSSKCNYFPGST